MKVASSEDVPPVRRRLPSFRTILRTAWGAPASRALRPERTSELRDEEIFI